MAEVTAEMVQKLREKTRWDDGLQEGAHRGRWRFRQGRRYPAQGERGQIREKSQSRVAAEGAVGAYIHMGGKIGVLVEVNCETDFVARGEDFQRFVKDRPCTSARRSRSSSARSRSRPKSSKEREIARSQAMADPKNANKPANIIDKMIDGRMEKFFTEVALLEQPFVKDQTLTVADLVKQITAKTGEKISIRRFTRYKMGEGLENAPTISPRKLRP